MKTTKLKPPRKTVIRGDTLWVVSAPKHGGTGRVRKTFRDRREAQTYYEQTKVQLHKHGSSAMQLDDRARADAVRALEILAPYKVNILDVARDYAKRTQEREGGKELTAAMEECLQAKRGRELSDRYVNDLDLRLTRFCKAFAGSTTTQIQSEQVSNFLGKLKKDSKLHPTTINTFLRDLRTFFKWCVTKGYCATNPAGIVERHKVTPAPITTLTAGQFSHLLRAAEDSVRATFVLAGFCAIRQGEIAKLNWANVDLKQRVVTIDASVAKTNSRRTVRIPSSAVEWLKPLAKKAGPVIEGGPKTRAAWDLARLAAGFGPFKTSLLRSRQAHEALTTKQLKALVPWPENALRHTAISARIALNPADAALAYNIDAGAAPAVTSIDAVALEAGNSPTIIKKHYNNLSKPKDAKDWYSVRP